MDLLAHSGGPPEWVPHGTGRCACTAEGEDPHCPHHGYEAVIARLRHELAGAVDPAEIVAWLRGRTGYGGGFTSADDVADAIERRFITER
jgi:hypothetical protein